MQIPESCLNIVSNTVFHCSLDLLCSGEDSHTPLCWTASICNVSVISLGIIQEKEKSKVEWNGIFFFRRKVVDVL